MVEELLRQRMLKGALGGSVSPAREVAEIPSAGLGYFKNNREGDMAATGTCSKCGREGVQIIGKGLCWKCRQEAIEDGTYGSVQTKAQKELTPSAVPPSPPPHRRKTQKRELRNRLWGGNLALMSC